MGFFLSDAINSALTAPGTNARQGQVDQQQQASQYAFDNLGQASSNLAGQLKFQGEQQPFAQNAINYL